MDRRKERNKTYIIFKYYCFRKINACRYLSKRKNTEHTKCLVSLRQKVCTIVYTLTSFDLLERFVWTVCNLFLPRMPHHSTSTFVAYTTIWSKVLKMDAIEKLTVLFQEVWKRYRAVLKYLTVSITIETIETQRL